MPKGLLLGALFVFNCGYRVFSKKSSNDVAESGRAGYALFLLLNGVTACVFFSVVSGFRLSLNGTTALYSMVYALIVIVSSCFTLKAYQLADVSSVTVIQSALSLITTAAVGFLLFHEKLDLEKISRIALMLVSIVLVFLDVRRHADSSERKRDHFLIFLFVVIVLIATTSGTTVLQKYYTMDPRAGSSNALFFYLNLFMLFPAGAWFALEKARQPSPPKENFSLMRPGRIFPIVLGTLCSNVTAIAGIRLLEEMDVSVYTAISSAIYIISGVLVSLALREKMGILQIAAAVTAAVAVII